MMLTPENLETLKKPFPLGDHEWLRGFVYLTEEAITNRLDEVDPSWSLEILDSHLRPSDQGQQVVTTVRLTVAGVWREGVGMQATHYLDTKDNKVKEAKSEAEKGAATDALKRAARLFGIGRYLLNAPDERQFSAWLQSLNSPNAKPVAGQPQAQPVGSASVGDGASNKPAQPKGKLDTALLLSLTGGLFSADDHAFNAFGKLTKAGTLTTKMSIDDQLAVIQADRLHSWGEKEATNTLYVVSADAAFDLDKTTTIRWRKLVLTPDHNGDNKAHFNTIDPDGIVGTMVLPPNALLIAQSKDIPF